MTYESWRISFQSSEQAARAAYAEAEALRAEVAQMNRRLVLANARKTRHKKRAKEFKSELMGVMRHAIEVHTGEDADGCGMRNVEVDALIRRLVALEGGAQ